MVEEEEEEEINNEPLRRGTFMQLRDIGVSDELLLPLAARLIVDRYNKALFMRISKAFNHWKYKNIEEVNSTTYYGIPKALLGLLVRPFRTRLAVRKRYYFDVWKNAAKLEIFITNMEQRTMELEVGLQQVESDKTYVRILETANSRLKLSILMTRFFYKWKSNIAESQLIADRRVFEEQQKETLREIQQIKEVIDDTNRKEAALLSNSERRGQEMVMQLIHINGLMRMKAVKAAGRAGATHAGAIT